MGPAEYEWDFIWMTLVVFIPSVFALGLLFFPRGKENAMRWWSLIGTALTLGVSLGMFVNFRNDTVELSGVVSKAARDRAMLTTRAQTADSAQPSKARDSHDWLTRYEWIKNFHIDYYLGVDGISMAMVLLTTALSFLAMIASWKIDKFVRGYMILFLVLETGMLGTFLALDFFLFYIFWEVMLLPMYFLIGVWGGPRREYAAIKFFLYTLLGSVFILVALLAFYFTNVRDFVAPERVEAQVGSESGADYTKARAAFIDADRDFSKAEEAAEQAAKELKTPKDDLAAAETAVIEAQTALDKDEKSVDLRMARDKARRRRDDARAALEAALMPNDKALRAGFIAERKLDLARIHMAQELSKLPIVVNSFDLVMLQHVGKTAQQYLHGEKIVSSPSIRAAEEMATKVKKRLEEAKADQIKAKADLDKAKADQLADAKESAKLADESVRLAEANVAPAEEAVQAARQGLDQRLHSEAFFTPAFQYAMFIFLFIGFAIKVPVFPFHTWLPDAHVEAPTPISMILAGVLLKLGGYGIIRIAYPICPWAAEQLAFWVALLGIINIVYGAFAAMAQTDFKKLVAYSSISHMGYVILGIAVWSTGDGSKYWAWGMNGAMFQMIAHGITSAGMFFMVGVIYDRAHHRNLDNFRGLYEPMPLYGGISAVIFFAAMGLPGMCGFVGEFLVVLSAWNFAPPGYGQWVGITFSVLSALTVVLTAAYILWTIQRVFMGQNEAYKNFKDMDLREFVAAVPLVGLAVLFGVAPFLIFNWMEPTVTGLIDALASFK